MFLATHEIILTGDGPRSAVDQALLYIVSLLDLRRFSPGDRLPPAADLAESAGVSRPAALQALRILADRGRVIVKPGRGGTWVTENDSGNLSSRLARAWEMRHQILQMADLRTVLEPGVVDLLARRGIATDDLNAAYELASIMEGTDADEVDDYRALDNEFHLLLARATRVPAIERAVTVCRIGVAAAFDVMEVPPDRITRSNAEHDQILKAIVGKDPSTARELMYSHVSESAELLRRELARDQPPTGERTRRARESVARKRSS